jgi:hypothetical protein
MKKADRFEPSSSFVALRNPTDNFVSDPHSQLRAGSQLGDDIEDQAMGF